MLNGKPKIPIKLRDFVPNLSHLREKSMVVGKLFGQAKWGIIYTGSKIIPSLWRSIAKLAERPIHLNDSNLA